MEIEDSFSVLLVKTHQFVRLFFILSFYFYFSSSKIIFFHQSLRSQYYGVPCFLPKSLYCGRYVRRSINLASLILISPSLNSLLQGCQTNPLFLSNGMNIAMKLTEKSATILQSHPGRYKNSILHIPGLKTIPEVAVTHASGCDVFTNTTSSPELEISHSYENEAWTAYPGSYETSV